MIVVLAGYYPPPLGGESVHVQELQRRLNVLGCATEIVNLRRGAPRSCAYRTVSNPLNFIIILLTRVKPEKIFHLHANGHSRKNWLMICVAALIVKLRKSSGILTIHSGLCPGYLAKERSLVRRLLRTWASSFRRIVCVNEEISRSMVGLGVPVDRLSVIPAFLGLEKVPPLSDGDSKLIGQMRPLIVVVGGIEPEYGLSMFVDTLPDLVGQFPTLGCVIIGANDSVVQFKSGSGLKLRNRVLVIRQMSHDRLLSILSNADVFVRPSYFDGDSITVREALALGIPVVASNTGTRPEGVFLFKPNDGTDLVAQIGNALRNRRNSPGELQKCRSQSFEQLLDIYQDLAKKSMRAKDTR